MFHTFQTLSQASAGTEGPDGNKAKSSGSRRISTSNACVECRRRKIRCDGLKPCGQCQWYQHPELCNYHKPAQRVVPSRKLVEKLTSQIEQYKIVMNRLIPKRSVESLVTSTREELLELVLSANASAMSPTISVPATLTFTESVSRSDGADSLEALEEAPEESPEWDEVKKHQGKVQGVSDDINGLQMSVDRLSSYVGISSIPAALKVIVKNAPYAKSCINHDSTDTIVPSRGDTPAEEVVDRSPTALPKADVGQALIESYFDKVHTFFPMVDERKFWTTYLYGERKDAPWYALLNMVFALGSLASNSSDSEAHTIYFTRARHHLSLESFGSGSLEVLQAIGMMSGYYMHYLNRPNEAHALMGGTLRMATSLGLHREYIEPPPRPVASASSASRMHYTDAVSGEMRRRIWWSLFCLDSWASTTSGRPSLGRMGPSITVLPPGKLIDQKNTMAAQSSQTQMNEALKILPLIHFSEFCKVATKIQDRLIEQPLMKVEELNQLDAEIVRWRDELPSILTNFDEECPEFLRVPRAVMKWRYQNLRIVLHRPTLLSAALRRVPFNLLDSDEKVAIGKCRIIAAKTIEDISSECTTDLVSGWNGVWFCYQACMIPLVSMFSDQSSTDEIAKWSGLLETATSFFERMRHHSVAAKSSGDLVVRLLDAFSTAQEEAATETSKLEALQQQEQDGQPPKSQEEPQEQEDEEQLRQEKIKQENKEEQDRQEQLQEQMRRDEMLQQQQQKKQQQQYHRQQQEAHMQHQRRLSQQQHQQRQRHAQSQTKHKRRLSEQFQQQQPQRQHPQRHQPQQILHQHTPPPHPHPHQQHHHLQHQSQQLHPDYIPFTTVDGFVSAVSTAASQLGIATAADLTSWPDPSGMGSLSGVWDEMMWDHNLPDMSDNLYYNVGEYDYAQAAHDVSAPQSWAFGQ